LVIAGGFLFVACYGPDDISVGQAIGMEEA
jgi:hypothetical protein